MLLETAIFADRQGFMLHGEGSWRGIYARDAAFFLCRRVLEGESPSEAVSNLEKLISMDDANAVLVMPLGGVTISHEVNLGNGIRIVPIETLPENSQVRSIAEKYAQGQMEPGSQSFPPMEQKVALICDKTVRPLLTRIVDGEFERPDYSREAAENLEDARLALSLIGPSCPLSGGITLEYREPPLDDPYFWAGTRFQLSEVAPPAFVKAVEISPDDATAVVSSVFSLDESFRARIRLALQRFSQAMKRRPHGDRAIDLSIALESLLVEGPGELRYRLALRAALLVDEPLEKRKEIRRTLADLYEVRSALVHDGVLPTRNFHGKKASEVVEDATVVSARVLRSFLAAGKEPDWPNLELTGGMPAP
ncbi:MAG: hypothetical protein IH851_05160 [Armatimonadetes bacterium]|nr:hypothetical protein [Armatimonadota bacterium]